MFMNDAPRPSDAVAFRHLWNDAVGRGSGLSAVSEQTLRLVAQVNRRESIR